jgi:hypothetical protein
MFSLNKLNKIKKSISKIKRIKDDAKKIKDRRGLITNISFGSMSIFFLYFIESELGSIGEGLIIDLLLSVFCSGILSFFIYFLLTVFAMILNFGVSKNKLFSHFFKTRQLSSLSKIKRVIRDLGDLEDFEKLLFDNFFEKEGNLDLELEESELIALIMKDYILEKNSSTLKIEVQNLRKIIKELDSTKEVKEELLLLLNGKIAESLEIKLKKAIIKDI